MRALISVYDKSGIVDFATNLNRLGIEIISTGGTARYLKENGLNIIQVQQVTSFPEILDGRVKTLHPAIHGAILAKRDKKEHIKELEMLSIVPIDIVVVNLYPFKETVQKTDDIDEILENIDIGGPAMLRSAAKNYKDVLVLCDPSDYQWLADKLSAKEKITEQERMKLALKAFEHTAYYDAMICEYFRKRLCIREFSETFTQTFEKVCNLRYGENPHQKAALYKDVFARTSTIVNAKQLQGKELSFNNICDADAAVELVKEFDMPCAVAVKHTNPCGVACAEDIHIAFEKAYSADPVSIFGGIVALNRPVDGKLAQRLSEIFLEVVIAPDYETEALAVFSKKKNLRILKMDFSENQEELDLRKISGGILLQTKDTVDYQKLEVVTEKSPTEKEMTDLLFAWKVVKHAKSNAIVIAKDLCTLAVGTGQVNRLWPTEHCVRMAGEKAKNAVLASDAFFPFSDAVEVAAKAGISAIIQPGGSIRDQQVIEIANRYNIAMVFTGTRHFKH